MTTTNVFVDVVIMGLLGAALFYAAITNLRTRMHPGELPPGFDQPQTQDELTAFLQGGGRRWIFKHSVACSVSAYACQEFSRFLAAHEGETAALIVVQGARDLSNRVAEEFGIRHESPQVFLLVDGDVRWHASHGQINADNLDKALHAEVLDV